MMYMMTLNTIINNQSMMYHIYFRRQYAMLLRVLTCALALRFDNFDDNCHCGVDKVQATTLL